MCPRAGNEDYLGAAMSEIPAECAVCAELFPHSVSFACVRVQDAPPDIREQERPAIRTAVKKRLREFNAGRFCARQALGRFGFAGIAITHDADGAPQWPPGIVGSITHSSTYAASAVARTADLRGIGVDLETVSRLSPIISAKILTPPEEACMQSQAGPARRQRLLALIFSAKEAAYKCLYPLVRRRIGFGEARVEHDAQRSELCIYLAERLREDLPAVGCLQGRYYFFNDSVCSAVWLAA